MQCPVVLCPWPRRLSVGLVASLGLAALYVGCGQTREGPPATAEEVYSTPPASFPALVEAPRDSISAYAASLQFDPVGAAEQPLPIWDATGNVVRTVNVRIEPERGVANLTEDQLRAGRIIARFIAEAEYPGFGLPEGVSYVWVDAVGDSLREVIIPERALDSVRIMSMGAPRHGPQEEPVARLFATSDSAGCCMPCPPPRGNCPCKTYYRIAR